MEEANLRFTWRQEWHVNRVSQQKDPGKETAGKRSRPDRLPRPEELGKEGPLRREMA